MENILNEVVNKLRLIKDESPSVDIFDLDYFEERLESLRSAFPESDFILNAVALKANSIRGILQIAMRKGMGAECASISEAIHALSIGFKSRDVVFDSPCKTKVDLKIALNEGIVINLDNEKEMELIQELLNSGECQVNPEETSIGLRINPLVGGGSIDIMSTATISSKFGLPLSEAMKSRILELYKKYEWLSGIHIHIGSQGVPMEKFVDGAKLCMDFVKEIESDCGRSLRTVDIGGGLSTSYIDKEEPADFSYALYRQRLNEKVPELFSGKRRVITEFGRSLFLKAGKTLTRVEYVKRLNERVNPIILTNVGTNQFIREAYLPKIWRHRFSVVTSDGKEKVNSERKVVYNLAGPMCFQGDYLAKDVELPEVDIGDILIIHDTGAYTMSMYSKYNSILASPVYGYCRVIAQNDLKVFCFKERETPEEALAFWGLTKPKIFT